MEPNQVSPAVAQEPCVKPRTPRISLPRMPEPGRTTLGPNVSLLIAMQFLKKSFRSGATSPAADAPPAVRVAFARMSQPEMSSVASADSLRRKSLKLAT